MIPIASSMSVFLLLLVSAVRVCSIDVRLGVCSITNKLTARIAAIVNAKHVCTVQRIGICLQSLNQIFYNLNKERYRCDNYGM
jgi:hypothetical protein